MKEVSIVAFIIFSQVLKRHEYFGKFGKIHKVVINQSTSYAGSQGPSASAYVTYQVSYHFLFFKRIMYLILFSYILYSKIHVISASRGCTTCYRGCE